jgi:hypothetical protein
MLLPLIAAIAVAQPTCVLSGHGMSCFDWTSVLCPRQWKKTRWGCWDGHKMHMVTSVTRRTTTDIVGHKHP